MSNAITLNDPKFSNRNLGKNLPEVNWGFNRKPVLHENSFEITSKKC